MEVPTLNREALFAALLAHSAANLLGEPDLDPGAPYMSSQLQRAIDNAIMLYDCLETEIYVVREREREREEEKERLGE